ncbi:MAG: molecular chaperone TorD family protein [Haloarculaceae archaeon]
MTGELPAATRDGLDDLDLDPDPVGRGALYAAFATLVEEPSKDVHERLADGRFEQRLRALFDRTTLDVTVPEIRTDDDYDGLCARYNDCFQLGYAEYEDRSDGTLSSSGPPVPIHESSYRDDAAWNDVNVDLTRAYDYFGVETDADRRRHHDHARLELEFMGYLCRREAAVDPDVARARLDFADRHLHVLATGMADAVATEPGTDVYEPLLTTLDELVDADRRDLADRLDR